MKILFEEYQYNTKLLSTILGERYFFPINSTLSKINFVGYYFNPDANNGKGDAVIIFPKVFINDHLKAFEEFTPEELVNPSSDITKKLKATGKDKIIFEISTWLYRAIQQYNKRNPENVISETQHVSQVISYLDNKNSIELEIILIKSNLLFKTVNLFI